MSEAAGPPLARRQLLGGWALHSWGLAGRTQGRIIAATLKAPFEHCFLVDLSDVQHIQLNRNKSRVTLVPAAAERHQRPCVWSEPSGLMNPPTVTSPAH